MSEASQEPSTHPPEPPVPAGGALSEAELIKARAADFARVLRQLTPRVFVTQALVAINLTVYVLGIASGVSLTDPSVPDVLKWGGNFGPNVLAGEWWRIFTCLFVHIGIIHIAMNMLVLASVGPLVERLVGNTGFLVLYIASGLCGSLLSLCYHPLVVSAGASGAIFGVYGALIAVLRQKSGAVPSDVLDRIRKAGLAFVGYNLVFGFMLNGIDNAAHVGGLVAGFLCGVVLNLPLSSESRAKRPARNVLAAVCGLVLVAAGAGVVLALYSDLDDAMTELDRAPEMEKRVEGIYTSARTRADRSELSLTDFANVIERDVLPEWRATAERINNLQNVPSSVREHLVVVLEYMKLRRQAWELEVQAARANDGEMMQQAYEAHSRANAAASKMKPPDK